jgi:hypothetical protein
MGDRSPIEGQSASRGRWHVNARIIAMVAALAGAIAFATLAHILKHSVPPPVPENPDDWASAVRFVQHLSNEVAKAFLIGGVTAALFEFTLHKHVIGNLLVQINEQVTTSGSAVSAGIQDLIAKHGLVRQGAQRGLVSVHQRAESRPVVEKALEALSDAESPHPFLFISVRSYPDALDTPRGWLLHLLDELIRHRPECIIAVLLPDGFSPLSQSEYRRQAQERGARKQVFDTRNVAAGLILRASNHGYGDNLSVRIAPYPPNYALIMTSERAFVEQYLPSMYGGTLPIYEFTAALSTEDEPTTISPYDAYAMDFAKVFLESKPARQSMEEYVKRKLAVRKSLESSGAFTKPDNPALASTMPPEPSILEEYQHVIQVSAGSDERVIKFLEEMLQSKASRD